MRAAACAMAALLCACSIVNDPSAHQSGEADAGPSLDAEELCARVRELSCRSIFHCCLNMPAEGTEYERCLDELEAAGSCGVNGVELRDLAADPTLGYDPHVAADVIAEAFERIDRCDLTLPGWYASRAGFWRMFPGTLAPGSDCRPASLAPFDYRIIFRCAGTDHRCLPSDLETWTCAVSGTTGQRCIISTDCAEGLYCAPGAMLGEDRCDDRHDEGSLCGSSDACESFVCNDLSVCAPARMRQDVFCP